MRHHVPMHVQRSALEPGPGASFVDSIIAASSAPQSGSCAGNLTGETAQTGSVLLLLLSLGVN